MKIKHLTIKNIGALTDVNISLDKPLLLFYGECRQGKTTILNAIRYAFGGPFPTDILKHGELEGIVSLTTDEGRITREFYRAENGEIKARPLTVIKDGNRVAKPVEWLKKFLNPFLLDGEYLATMTADERKKYFVELFGTSTALLDAEYDACEVKARELRAVIKSYGALDVARVERVDVEALRDKLRAVMAANSAEKKSVLDAIAAQDAHNSARLAVAKSLQEQEEEHSRLLDELDDLNNRISAHLVKNKQDREWLAANPERAQTFEPEIVHTQELEDAISNAAANNVRAEIYEANVAKIEKRRQEESSVAGFESRQREINAEKVERLAKLTAECGVPGLVFLDKGNFKYEDTDAGMLSTSQIMRLSSALSALYPEGIGIELLDRGESLGKSIFDYVERAKAGNKTILATIVGERPAVAPENVGVFVVEGGTVV